MTEKLNVLRVDLLPVGVPDASVLIIPEYRTAPDFREFYIQHGENPNWRYMFGCAVETDEDAVEIALSNAPQYTNK